MTRITCDLCNRERQTIKLKIPGSTDLVTGEEMVEIVDCCLDCIDKRYEYVVSPNLFINDIVSGGSDREQDYSYRKKLIAKEILNHL